MARIHPKEFRTNVMTVVLRGDAPISQAAKDLGISGTCLRTWLHAAEIADYPTR